jgi:DNA-binding helix-hairpin-helix protein with protein kinase domain
LATLLSYGIETAADLTEDGLDAIPGFGPATIRYLMTWRQDMERGFRFDANRPAPRHVVQAILMKYRQLQQSCAAELSSGADEMNHISKSAAVELEQIASRIASIVEEVRRADADLKVA